LSQSGVVHPPRSNPPLRSSSGLPIPCITPSTETNVVVVSFMVAVPFSLVGLVSSFGPDHAASISSVVARSVLQVHAVPSPNKGRMSAMSYSATDAESIAAPCSLLGPLLQGMALRNDITELPDHMDPEGFLRLRGSFDLRIGAPRPAPVLGRGR
jgi:hypothetical protein